MGVQRQLLEVVFVPGQDDKDKPRPTGRVRHDKSGRAIWEWAIDSGRDALDSTSRLLKKLDISSLRLLGDDEQTWNKTKPSSPDELPPGVSPSPPAKPVLKPVIEAPRDIDPAAHKRPSFDPYDNRTPARPAARSKPPRPALRSKAPVKARKRGLLAKLFRRDK